MYDNSNSGALFKNDKKTGPNSPNMRGQCEPVCPSCGAQHKFWVSAWTKTSKKGDKFVSLALTPDDPQARYGQSSNEHPLVGQPVPDDFDPDIPFAPIGLQYRQLTNVI